MMLSTNNPGIRNLASVLVAASIIVGISACSKKHIASVKKETTVATPAVMTDPAPVVVPAENKGQVQIKRDINSNYVILINLRELEDATKIEPASKKAYIVWMNADKQLVKKLGQINSNEGWLSDKSKASFEAISEFKPTKIYITEEDESTAKTPGKKIVWSTNGF